MLVYLICYAPWLYINWEVFHAYFLHMICYYIVDIIVDMHSQKWINISFFS